MRGDYADNQYACQCCQGQGPPSKAQIAALAGAFGGSQFLRWSKVMNVTRDVITDLLPAYFSGEASEDTVSLVEDCFKRDPEFERLVRRSSEGLDLDRLDAFSKYGEREKNALRRTRKTLKWQKIWFVLAVICSLAPFSLGLTIATNDLHLDWFMLRDDPRQAVMLFAQAAIFWTIYFSMTRRLRIRSVGRGR